MVSRGDSIRRSGAAEGIGPRGYTLGRRARNYGKELVIDSAVAAEAGALRCCRSFAVFGYRGQWRLEVERHWGERADHEPVYTSVTPDDFADSRPCRVACTSCAHVLLARVMRVRGAAMRSVQELRGHQKVLEGAGCQERNLQLTHPFVHVDTRFGTPEPPERRVSGRLWE